MGGAFASPSRPVFSVGCLLAKLRGQRGLGGAPPTLPMLTALLFPHLAPAQDKAAVATATKDAPFVNSLGMEFVPVPGTKVLFCRTVTRVRDFRAYGKATDYFHHYKNAVPLCATQFSFAFSRGMQTCLEKPEQFLFLLR